MSCVEEQDLVEANGVARNVCALELPECRAAGPANPGGKLQREAFLMYPTKALSLEGPCYMEMQAVQENQLRPSK